VHAPPVGQFRRRVRCRGGCRLKNDGVCLFFKTTCFFQNNVVTSRHCIWPIFYFYFPPYNFIVAQNFTMLVNQFSLHVCIFIHSNEPRGDGKMYRVPVEHRRDAHVSVLDRWTRRWIIHRVRDAWPECDATDPPSQFVTIPD